jgi:uncharacterized membrane protein
MICYSNVQVVRCVGEEYINWLSLVLVLIIFSVLTENQRYGFRDNIMSECPI